MRLRDEREENVAGACEVNASRRSGARGMCKELRKTVGRAVVALTTISYGIACSPDDGTPETNDESDAECSVAPCGGDVVGSWQFTSLCGLGALEQLPVEGCSGTSDATGLQPTGTVTFAADGNYSVMLSLGGPIRFSFPVSCLTSGSATTCEELNQALAPLTQGDASLYESFTCSGTDTCECVAHLRGVTLEDSGTYVVSGSSMTMTGMSGEVSHSTYCASGPTLAMQDASEDSSGMSFVSRRQ